MDAPRKPNIPPKNQSMSSPRMAVDSSKVRKYVKAKETSAKLQARSYMTPRATSETKAPAPASTTPASLVSLFATKAAAARGNHSDDVDTTTRKSDGGYRGSGDYLKMPLEFLTKEEVKASLKQSDPRFRLNYSDDDDNNEEEVIEDSKNAPVGPDRARFNLWKGKNYDLHVLGNFKSDFEKRVRAFQRPETTWVSMDPFCRADSGLDDEPAEGEAFLIWKCQHYNWDFKEAEINKGEDTTDFYLPGVSSNFGNITTSDDSESDVDSCSSSGSYVEPELKKYILDQKQKRKAGVDTTGETLYYDDEFGVIRNLHRDSHSLTNYGVLPDEKFIGKAHIFYPEMTKAEKDMLTPCGLEAVDVGRSAPPKKKSPKSVTSGTPRSSRNAEESRRDVRK